MSLYRAHAWVLVHTGERAIKLLGAYDFDIISLDYNLSGELTGLDIAQRLFASRNKDAKVIIHSLNPKGVEQISNVLPDALVYPVSKMIRTNRHFKRLRAELDNHGVDFNWKNPIH